MIFNFFKKDKRSELKKALMQLMPLTLLKGAKKSVMKTIKKLEKDCIKFIWTAKNLKQD